MNQLASGRVNCIAVSSQKGGVAKTTTALSLGACLAEDGANVLMVDMDPQGHLTQAIGLNPDELRWTIGDALLNQATLVEVSRETPVYNLDIVPANRGLILVEKILHDIKDYEYRLKTDLKGLNSRYYDLVMFDCPPSFGPLTVNALTASELVVVPVVCDYFSARSLQSFLRLLEMLRRNSNPMIQHRLLVTLYDKRLRLSRLMLDQFRFTYNGALFDTMTPIDSKLRESPVFGRPITEYASSARSAHYYRVLARELMTCLEVTI